MTVCVTGGTGFVGQGVVPELLKSGFKVRALVRSERSVQKLAITPKYKQDIEFVFGDPCKTSDIATALDGCTALLHLVGIRRHEIKKTGKAYEDIDVGSTIAAAEAMGQSGMKRIILLSAGAIGNSVYVQCKAKAEKAVTDARLDWRILRPSFIIGPGQQWPLLLYPILAFFSLFPGHFGDVARRAGNISRNQLSKAFVHYLRDNDSIGKIYDVPTLKQVGSRRL